MSKKKLLIFFFFFFVFCLGVKQVFGQASTNYKLKSYELGGGGGETASSTNFSVEGLMGQIAGALSSTNYKTNAGLLNSQQSNVPPAPTFVNSSNWYNKLKLTVNRDTGDPTDTKYAIAISTDAFASDTKYVQSDGTVGATLGAEDYQTYSSWGGASGAFIIGLVPNTTYTVKLKSYNGIYTESGYGPTASVATSNLLISFDVDIGGPSDPGETGAPYTVPFGSLSIGSVNTATDKAWVDLTTNAEAGGFVYIYDQYGGLKSSNLNYTITSSTADLASAGEGFGVQGSSKTQSSGGPLEYTSPYNGSSQNVGVVSSTIREIFNTTSSPVTSARGSFVLKTRVASTTPGANDYADNLTLIATAAF